VSDKTGSTVYVDVNKTTIWSQPQQHLGELNMQNILLLDYIKLTLKYSLEINTHLDERPQIQVVYNVLHCDNFHETTNAI